MQPFIAITVGEFVRDGLDWAPVVYGQSHTYTDSVVHAGGVPFIMPIVKDESVLRRLYEQCSAVLFSGGDDIGSNLYDADPLPNTKCASPERDHQELQLLRWALEDNKPVLGICRGMQLINVGLGGTLHQDIAAILPEATNHEASADQKDFSHLAHRLVIDNSSRLAEILGTKQIDTNALHHQAIDKLGQGLVISAHAEDGIIEAIELPDKHFVIGVQSHPEALESAVEPLWCKLFLAFVAAASAKP